MNEKNNENKTNKMYVYVEEPIDTTKIYMFEFRSLVAVVVVWLKFIICFRSMQASEKSKINKTDCIIRWNNKTK